MSEEDTKHKQIYLRKEILEKGYDANKFVEYLSSKRENGEDIDNWSTASLEEAVKNYVGITPKPEGPPKTLPDAELSEGESPSPRQLPPKVEEKSEDDEGTKTISPVPQVSQIEQTVMASLPAAKEESNTKIPSGDYSTVNDQRQQITQMILTQSEEEKAAMNDFTYNVPPLKKTFLNELNGERRLKVSISK